MATERSQEAIPILVEDRIMELKREAGCTPWYNGILVQEDKLLVIDYWARNFQLYNRSNGNLLYTSHKLESIPMGVYLISETNVAVCLKHSSILIMSLESIDKVTLVETLDVKKGFYECHSVAKLNSGDKLVVSGRKYFDIMCWGVVSIAERRVDSSHNICKGAGFLCCSHLAIKDNTVYISCWTPNSTVNGVYVYDISNPRIQMFLYQHQELHLPMSITFERNSIFLIDRESNKIHQLTESGQLKTIHTVQSRPLAFFYDDKHGLLYTTSKDSNVITVYRQDYTSRK